VLGVVVALETCALVVLLRRYGRLLMRLDDAVAQPADLSTDLATSGDRVALRVGMTAPTFALPNLDGMIWTLEALLALDRPIVFVFAVPSCGACSQLVPEVVQWQHEYADRLTLVVILTGTLHRGVGDLYQSVDCVLVQHHAQVMDSYSIRGTPSAILVGSDGVVSSPVARGASEIRALVGAASESP
jgi:hypothetical protein